MSFWTFTLHQLQTFMKVVNYKLEFMLPSHLSLFFLSIINLFLISSI